MNRLDIEKALKSQKLHDWFNANVDGLIAGKNAGFYRENEITSEIVDCIANSNIQTQKSELGRGVVDIIDTTTNDVIEAAHNGTFQDYRSSLNHMAEDYQKRISQGYNGKYFTLIYLMHIDRLDPNSQIPKSYATAIRSKPKAELVATKALVEKFLKALPNGIVHHEQFHGLKTPNELLTILDYDIYLMEL